MKTHTRIFSSILIAFLISIQVQGATWIVSPSGLDSNAGTLESPWSLEKAIASVNPGDIVYLRGGSYNGYYTLTRGGTSENARVTFRNYGGESPVIDGSSKKTDPANAWDKSKYLFQVYADYITFRGLEMMNSAGFGIYVGADYCVVDSCHLHNNYFAGAYFFMCSYGTVSNCVIHDNYDYGVGGIGGGDNSDGIGGSAGNDLPYPDYGHHHIINNVVYNTSDDGIDLWSSRGNTIENNMVYHTGFGNPSNGGSQPSTWDQPAATGNGTGIKSGGEGAGSGQTIIKNNVVFNCPRRGGFDGSGGENNVYYNNTVYNCSNGFIYIGTTAVLKNNLVANCIQATNDVRGTASYNSWNMGITDPGFISTDPANENFLWLSVDSPAKDAGIKISSVKTDRIGTIRPQGIGYDLGAYEWYLLTGLNEAEQAKLKVFPNPSTGLITVRLANSNASVISVYNSIGNSLLQVKTSKNEEILDLSDYKGMVLIKVVNANKEYFTKVVIK